MSNRTFAVLLGALVVAAAPARAQLPSITPFSFEGRAGLAVPTGDFNDAADPGWTIGGTVTYHAFPLVGIYGGFSLARFDADGDFGGGDGELNDSGVDVGVRLAIPTPLIPIDPWIRAGVVIHKLETTGFANDAFNSDGDTAFGYELGAGLGFGFGPVSITPGVSVVRQSTDNTLGDDFEIGYVKADLGVRIRL